MLSLQQQRWQLYQLIKQTANIAGQLILLVVLTAVNAFFAAAEMAIVSINKTKMKMLANEGNKKANTICKLVEEPTKFLSTIQVAITLSGFFASASAATGISTVVGKMLTDMNIPYGEQISFVGVTIILSYFTLVFGELFPKRLAIKKADKLSMLVVNPILFVSKIAAPFVKILSVSTNVLVKLFGLDSDDSEERVTKEEIKSLVETGEEHGAIDESEKEMIESVFEFDDKIAEKVMTPRTEVYCIDINEPLEEYLDELLQKRFARIPVYEDEIDNIIGVLYMKDFMIEARNKGFENVNIQDILQEPYFVPECKSIRHLFRDLQDIKRHIAIIVDEYGGFSGIITVEDLVEEIVGDINDEDDEEEFGIRKVGDLVEEIVGDINDEDDEEEFGIRKVGENCYLVDGTTQLDELNENLNLDVKSDELDTLNGFLINLIGKIPLEDEEKEIKYNNIVFKIDEVSDKKIEKVRICL